MHFLTGITKGVVVNPLPVYTQQDEDLLNKYHLIPKRNPWKSKSDFISYVFLSLMIWKKVFCEFFCSLDKLVIALVNKESKKRNNEIKSTAYFFWESLCLPIVFIAGFFFKEVRNAFSSAPLPVTEDYARREAVGLKDEIAESEQVVKEKEDCILWLEKRISALEVSLSEEIAVSEGITRTPSPEEIITAVNGATDILKKEHEAKMLALQKQLKEATINKSELPSKEKELNHVNGQLVKELEALKTYHSQQHLNGKFVPNNQIELLENIKRQRAHSNQVVLTKTQLDKFLGE